jgi:hypothetical protein
MCSFCKCPPDIAAECYCNYALSQWYPECNWTARKCRSGIDSAPSSMKRIAAMKRKLVKNRNDYVQSGSVYAKEVLTPMNRIRKNKNKVLGKNRVWLIG